jgi:hypothetical protein
LSSNSEGETPPQLAGADAHIATTDPPIASTNSRKILHALVTQLDFDP